MKVRIGFVSNSSSSSFILWLDPSVEYTLEHIKELMFGKKSKVQYEYYSPKYNGKDERYLDTNVLAQWVFDEISRGLEDKHIFARLRELIDEQTAIISDNEFNVYIDISNKYNRMEKAGMTDTQKQNIWQERFAAIKELDKQQRKRAVKIVREDIRANLGKIPVVIGFSDNDGRYGCHLEQSGIIEKVFKAKRVSHH